jgi:hypothetical protein
VVDVLVPLPVRWWGLPASRRRSWLMGRMDGGRVQQPSMQPCNHAAMPSMHPSSIYLITTPPLPLPPRARLAMPSTRLHRPLFVYALPRWHLATPVMSCNIISVDASLPLRLSTLPVYHQTLPFQYHIIYRIHAQKSVYFWLPHRAASVASPLTPLQPTPYAYTHTHPFSTPSSCSSPSSPPC